MEKNEEGILDKIQDLIDHDLFDIEVIDQTHPSERASFYEKLRELMEEHFPEILDLIKYAGKDTLNKLELKLKQQNQLNKYKLLKIVRAIYYC